MTFRILCAKPVFFTWLSRGKRRRKTRVLGDLVVKRAGSDYGNEAWE